MRVQEPHPKIARFFTIFQLVGLTINFIYYEIYLYLSAIYLQVNFELHGRSLSHLTT